MHGLVVYTTDNSGNCVDSGWGALTTPDAEFRSEYCNDGEYYCYLLQSDDAELTTASCAST